MSTPIVETIATKLVALIDGITIANGFNQTLTAVRPKRIHLEGDLNADNTIFICQGEGHSEIDTNDGLSYWAQNFLLQGLVIDSDNATDPIDVRCNKVAADICKQLFTENNRTFDELLDNLLVTRIERIVGIVDEQPQSLIEVEITMRYLLRTGNPYSQT